MISLHAVGPRDVDGVRSLVAGTLLATYGPFSPAVRRMAAEEGMAALVSARLDFAGAWLAREDAGRLVGVVWTRDDLLRELFVAPSAQRQGIGRLLLHVAEREIAARGHGRARLDVAEPNAAARAFYAAQGWRETGASGPARWDFAMIGMEKALLPAAPPDPG